MSRPSPQAKKYPGLHLKRKLENCACKTRVMPPLAAISHEKGYVIQAEKVGQGQMKVTCHMSVSGVHH